MSDDTSDLPRDYTLAEVAEGIGMSTRWVRDRIREGAEHQRYGHVIKFTRDQYDKLRADHTKAPASQPITTRRKRAS